MASPNISFEQILSSTRKPGQYLEWNTKLALRNLPTNRQKVLLLAAHTASLGALTELTEVVSEDAIANRYGAGSQAHLMVRAALTAYANAALSLITIADHSAGVAAKGSLVISGTATSDGILRITLGAADTLLVAVNRDDTAKTVAEAAAKAINDAGSLPVTAAAADATVNISAKNKGTEGNSITLAATVSAAGIGAQVTALSGGDGDPDIAPALAAVAAEGHDIIVCGFNGEENLLKLRRHLETVANPYEKRWAIGIYGHSGSLAQATTLAKKLNNGFMLCAWYRGTPSLPSALAAAYGVVMASEEDPARPLNTLALPGIAVCASKDKTLRSEQESALYNGVAPVETGADGTTARIVRAITTYVVSSNGTADESLLDVTTVRTLIYVSRAITQRIALRFPREKLNDKTAQRVRSELIDVLMRCEELEILEHVEANLDKLLVERDSQNPGMLDARIPADVVNGLHVFAAVVDLYL